MESIYKDIVSSGSEYDVRFCLKHKGMKVFISIKGKFKCEDCIKEINNKRRRKSDENIKVRNP